MQENKAEYSNMHWSGIKCPFFHGDSPDSINCEGAIGKSTIKQVFETKRKKQQFQAEYCMLMNGYSECPVFRIANEKYE